MQRPHGDQGAGHRRGRPARRSLVGQIVLHQPLVDVAQGGPSAVDEIDVGHQVTPIGGKGVRRPSSLDGQPREVLLDGSGELDGAAAHRCIMARTVDVGRTVTVVIPTRGRPP